MKCPLKGLIMQKRSMGNNIENFWNWFSANVNLLDPELITEKEIDILDSKLQLLGDFSWEIGYDDEKHKNFLVIPPEGDNELLKETKKIVGLAPKNINWSFYSFKPPKKWDLIFDLLIDDSEVSFDAKKWEYVLYKYPDNLYDIVIKVTDEDEKYKEYLYDAAFIALEGELGEEFVINRINEIEIVERFNPDQELKKRSFSQLKGQIEKNLLK